MTSSGSQSRIYRQFPGIGDSSVNVVCDVVVVGVVIVGVVIVGVVIVVDVLTVHYDTRSIFLAIRPKF